MMTEEDLKMYSTVPEMAIVFRDDFSPKGYFYILKEKKGTYVSHIDDKTWMWVMFEARAYKRLENGRKQLVANGFGREEQGASEFNKVNYHMTAQTRAIGRMFRNLGIMIDKGMATREEIESSEELMERSRKEERVARTPKVKGPGIRANLKRLRVGFEEKDDCYIIENYKNYKDKTMLALKKYGFEEVNDKLICAKDKDGN